MTERPKQEHKIKAQMANFSSYEQWANRMVKAGDRDAYRYLWNEVHQVEQDETPEPPPAPEPEPTPEPTPEPEQYNKQQQKQQQLNTMHLRNKKR